MSTGDSIKIDANAGIIKYSMPESQGILASPSKESPAIMRREHEARICNGWRELGLWRMNGSLFFSVSRCKH